MAAEALTPSLDGLPDELSQALTLLRAAGVGEPEALTLGEGDRRLLALHREVTGHDVDISAACTSCGTLNVATLCERELDEAAPRCAALGGGGVRPPTYADLQDLPGEAEAAVAELLRRCTVGEPARSANAGDVALVDDALTGPLELACVECGAATRLDVDLQRLVLERIVRWQRTIDVEVHLIASAYHWPLGEIEALEDERRSLLAGLIAEGR